MGRALRKIVVLAKQIAPLCAAWLVILLAVSTEGASPFVADSRPRIVAFGDSLTAGLGVQVDESYPAQLQRRLDSLGYHYRVINAGVSGDTTAGGLRRVSWILNSKPELVILELGANDGLRGIPVDETQQNLRQIVRRLQEAQVTVILAGMKLPPNYGQDYTTRFEAMYRTLAKEHQVAFIPFFLEGVGGSALLNQADGLHPTSEGYKVVVEHLLKVLSPMLSEREQKTNPSQQHGCGGVGQPAFAQYTHNRSDDGSVTRDALGFLEKRVVDAVDENERDQYVIQAGDSAIIRRPFRHVRHCRQRLDQ